MPARDKFHQSVRTALEKDGWKITHDPLKLKWGRKQFYVDIGAEKLLSAEKEGRKIAVEIKSFSSLSEVTDLEEALGQYLLYLAILQEKQSDRVLYLAVPEEKLFDLFDENDIGGLVLAKYKIKLIVYHPKQEVIVKWIE